MTPRYTALAITPLLVWLMLCQAAQPPTQLSGELDALMATGRISDRTIIERIRQFDRLQVLEEIRTRLQAPQPESLTRMEQVRYLNNRVALYEVLVAITDQGPDQGRWLTTDLIDMLRSGATEEPEYVRGHVLESFNSFRHDMPQPFRDAIVQSLASTTYSMVGARLGSLGGLIPRWSLLPKNLFGGFVFNPDQTHPELWQDIQRATSHAPDPENTIFFSFRLNAADALIRHCDLGEVVADWQQATDPLGKRALALAVFRKLWNPDAAFHIAPVETQVEAVRLACRDLDGMPANWIPLSGFLVTIVMAVADNTIQAEAVRAEIRTCLLLLKDLPDYAEYGDLIQAIIDQL